MSRTSCKGDRCWIKFGRSILNASAQGNLEFGLRIHKTDSQIKYPFVKRFVPFVDACTTLQRRHASTLFWGRLLWLVICLVLPMGCVNASPEISYVMEPFERFHHIQDWSIGEEFNISMTDDALFGKGAMNFTYPLAKSSSDSGNNESAATERVEFGWVGHGRAPHNCIGATHVSFWYKVLSLPQQGSLQLRLTLFDDSNCTMRENCLDRSSHKFASFASSYYDAEAAPYDHDSEWKQVQLDLSTDLSNVDGLKLNLEFIAGWSIDVSLVDSSDGLANTTILFDQLECMGHGNLFGAVLEKTTGYAHAVANKEFLSEYYQSPLSENRTKIELEDGKLSLNYTIEQTQSWGGFVGISHVLPDPGYFNISGAAAVALKYKVYQPASPAGRVHFRLILLDGRDCEDSCDGNGQALEIYYSFNSILDNISQGDSEFIAVDLKGDNDASSPFWRTGWSGAVGNNKLDPDFIKGFRFELSMDSQGDIGSLVTGELELRSLLAMNVSASKGNESTDLALCVSDWNDLSFHVTEDVFARLEFKSQVCCEACDEDPDCLYGLQIDEHCYLASSVGANNIGLINSEYARSQISVFATNNPSKLGDFCDVCECQEHDRLIDCRNRDIRIIPISFTPQSHDSAGRTWSPLTLDLRDNPNLTLFRSGSFDSISASLEEIRLPENMRFLPFDAMRSLNQLKIVSFEGDEDELMYPDRLATTEFTHKHSLINVITHPSGKFDDVCCGLGNHIDVESPAAGLTWCDMQVDIPGADAEYESFVTYFGADGLNTLHPTSLFMSEAAESAEKCAEYCAISQGCNYFSYDARWKDSEHTCYLLRSNGTRFEVCCHPDDFADRNGTLPGWISGRPPRTRNWLDNARVIVEKSGDLVMNKSNKYTAQFELKLGSTPKRGAVWIKPEISSSNGLNISISPARVVLYDATTRATITVSLLNQDVSTAETVILLNNIESCDSAFTSSDNLISENTLYIAVQPSKAKILIPMLVLAAVVCLLFLVGRLYTDEKKRQADAIWKVEKTELKFSNPAKIIGRGRFGLVLLAEYRGTQVAVKRVIPPARKKNGSTVKLKTELFGDALDVGTDSGNQEWTSKPCSDIESPALHSQSRQSLRMECNPKVSNNSQQVSSIAMPSIRRNTHRGRMGTMSFFGDEYERLKADFIVEMRILSKLRHPCITTVMGAVIENRKEPMLVMEYMNHGSLYDILHNETWALEGEFILNILRDITQGLRFLHSAVPQVIHGDLKSQNILVDNRFRAKVSDFGLSQKRQLEVTGTPHWMGPELLRGETGNIPASDVYAFGIILFEVYSRQDPYEGEDLAQVLQLVADRNVRKRPPIPSSCPSEIQHMMKVTLDDDFKCRPTFEELDKLLKGMDVPQVQPTCQLKKKLSRVRKTTQADKLLFEVFPKHVAEALLSGRRVEPESRDMVTIFFSDIVSFTDIAASLPALKISDMLNRLYSIFDELTGKHDIFKVETIGDAYMAVANLVKDQPDHTSRIAQFAMDAVQAARKVLIDASNPDMGTVSIRVGFHSGPIVANVVGSLNPRYCLFGDTVNVASRMESASLPNRIHCSERSAELLRQQNGSIGLRSRGSITVKGKGAMVTYWVNQENMLQSLRSGRSIPTSLRS